MSSSGMVPVTKATLPSRNGVPKSAKVRFQNAIASRTASSRESPAAETTVTLGIFDQRIERNGAALTNAPVARMMMQIPMAKPLCGAFIATPLLPAVRIGRRIVNITSLSVKMPIPGVDHGARCSQLELG